jgi:enterochelin esterase-like enzyme
VGTGEKGIHDSVNVTLGKIGKVGVKYVYREWPGLSHEWQLWRSCLNDFAPRLFR